jgi:hypothetical protein
VPIGVVIEIGILADIERALGTPETFREIAFDVARDGKIFRIFPQRIQPGCIVGDIAPGTT